MCVLWIVCDIVVCGVVLIVCCCVCLLYVCLFVVFFVRAIFGLSMIVVCLL